MNAWNGPIWYIISGVPGHKRVHIEAGPFVLLADAHLELIKLEPKGDVEYTIVDIRWPSEIAKGFRERGQWIDKPLSSCSPSS